MHDAFSFQLLTRPLLYQLNFIITNSHVLINSITFHQPPSKFINSNILLHHSSFSKTHHGPVAAALQIVVNITSLEVSPSLACCCNSSELATNLQIEKYCPTTSSPHPSFHRLDSSNPVYCFFSTLFDTAVSVRSIGLRGLLLVTRPPRPNERAQTIFLLTGLVLTQSRPILTSLPSLSVTFPPSASVLTPRTHHSAPAFRPLAPSCLSPTPRYLLPLKRCDCSTLASLLIAR